MRISKHYIIAPLLLLCLSAFSQVQVDHSIILTGAGTDAKLTGIRNVTDSLDATSVESIQSGTFIYAVATGSGNSFAINISPPINAYQPGMVFNFISNQTVTGPATLNVNNLGAVSITKYVNQQLAGCEIQTSQVVTVVYDGTNFQITSLLSPGQPATAPVAIAGGSGSLQITAYWQPVAAATGYYLDAATDAGFANILEGYNNANVGNVDSYSITGLNCGTTYYYRVRSSNSCIAGSSNSNTDSAATLPCCQDGTGGTITHVNGNTIHTFTTSGTFTPGCDENIQVLVVAGGGGGADAGGGGGAGGLIYDTAYAVTVQGYNVTVGAGGTGGTGDNTGGTAGNNSVFGTLTAIGGGAGIGQNNNNGNGGSGGGAPQDGTIHFNGGLGTAGQGNNGGSQATGVDYPSAGGGGAGGAGTNASPDLAGGGPGLSIAISGSPVYYAGGGGAGCFSCPGAAGGAGGGGNGTGGAEYGGGNGANGTANTGGGGGGSGDGDAGYKGGNGGSGIVIISYPTP